MLDTTCTSYISLIYKYEFNIYCSLSKFEVVDEAKATVARKIRLCILNPSLILAPQLQPGAVSGNGLPWFARIAKGEAMSDSIPNDSMSIIHCEDLAKLHVACFESAKASGRYFLCLQQFGRGDVDDICCD